VFQGALERRARAGVGLVRGAREQIEVPNIYKEEIYIQCCANYKQGVCVSVYSGCAYLRPALRVLSRQFLPVVLLGAAEGPSPH
jgi:hypothetical protein